MSRQPNHQPPLKQRRRPSRPDNFERKLWIAVAILIVVLIVSAIIFISQIGGVQ